MKTINWTDKAPDKPGLYLRTTVLPERYRLERVVERDGGFALIDPNCPPNVQDMPSGKPVPVVPIGQVTGKFLWYGPLPEARRKA